MRTKIFVIVMAAVIAIYLIAVTQTALRLMATENWIAKTLGVALIVLPILGAWSVWLEIRFGINSEALGRKLQHEGRSSLDDLPRLPSGRIDPTAATAIFDSFKQEAETHPDRWESWFRLGQAYDACGDRKRARASIRKAISLSSSRN